MMEKIENKIRTFRKIKPKTQTKVYSKINLSRYD